MDSKHNYMCAYIYFLYLITASYWSVCSRYIICPPPDHDEFKKKIEHMPAHWNHQQNNLKDYPYSDIAQRQDDDLIIEAKDSLCYGTSSKFKDILYYGTTNKGKRQLCYRTSNKCKRQPMLRTTNKCKRWFILQN